MGRNADQSAAAERIASIYIIYNIVYPAGTDKRCPAERCGGAVAEALCGIWQNSRKGTGKKQITEQKSVKSNKWWQKDAAVQCSRNMHSKNNSEKRKGRCAKCPHKKDKVSDLIHKFLNKSGIMRIKCIKIRTCMTGGGQCGVLVYCPIRRGGIGKKLV